MDRVIKLDAYHRARVRWAWLVEPLAQTVEVFEWSERGWLRVQTAEGCSALALSPFDGADVELEAIWPPDADHG